MDPKVKKKYPISERQREMMKENTKRFRKTKRGVLTNLYSHHRRRNRDRFNEALDYSLREFHDMFLNTKLFDRLYSEWVSSGYKLREYPSIDRIDPRKCYSKKNIHMMKLIENQLKAGMEQRFRGSKCRALNSDQIDKIRSDYESGKKQKDIGKEFDIGQSNVSRIVSKEYYKYKGKI